MCLLQALIKGRQRTRNRVGKEGVITEETAESSGWICWRFLQCIRLHFYLNGYVLEWGGAIKRVKGKSRKERDCEGRWQENSSGGMTIVTWQIGKVQK